jgi:hypothetical protein
VSNKKEISFEERRCIRNMFFKKAEIIDITSETSLKESVIRRVIKENNWVKARERYYKYLCYLSLKNGLPLCKIADLSKVKYYTLCRVRKKYNLKKCKKTSWNSKRTAQVEERAKDLYNDGHSGAKIARQLGYKRKESIYQILEENDVKRKESKRYTYYDEFFFEHIDSHEKAYILGLIMTDGNIIKNYQGFEIQLTKEDKYILEKISDIIGASKSHKVQNIDCSGKRRIEGFSNAKDMARVTVHNAKIAMDLKELGVVRNKTKIMRYNGGVPSEFLSSFFRGLVDGDGSVGFDNRGWPFLCIASASKLFLEDMLSLCPIKHTSLTKSKMSSGGYIWTFRFIGGRKQILSSIKWIYENKSDFYLRRKYDKVQDKVN